jgi:hypothetical protein
MDMGKWICSIRIHGQADTQCKEGSRKIDVRISILDLDAMGCEGILNPD